MMGDNGRRIFLVGEMLLQRQRDVGMDALTPAAQQRAVGGILHQRMLEDVARHRRVTALIDQFGFHQLVQGIIQCPPRDRRYRFQ
jgi:hypothetical protein